MTPNQLNEIRDRAEKATAGPWDVTFYDVSTLLVSTRSDADYVAYCPSRGATKTDNSIFIAHARQDIPALLAHIDALEARVKELESDGKRLDWLQGVIRHEIEPPEHYEDDVLKASLRQAIDAAIKASEGGNNE